MKAESADYLAKARVTLVDAETIAALPLPHIAAREAYLAVFHAVEACIFDQTGEAALTHRGARSEFARLAKAEPRISRDLLAFFAAAYQFKRLPTSSRREPTTPSALPQLRSGPRKQSLAIAMAARVVETIADVLGSV